LKGGMKYLIKLLWGHYNLMVVY